MVPYMFCSDEWVGSLANCNRWDEGADPAAILERTMNQWEDYYWFNNYKRDRVSFDTVAPANRALSPHVPDDVVDVPTMAVQPFPNRSIDHLPMADRCSQFGQYVWQHPDQAPLWDLLREQQR